LPPDAGMMPPAGGRGSESKRHDMAAKPGAGVDAGHALRLTRRM
jgi:hypothetical protein